MAASDSILSPSHTNTPALRPLPSSKIPHDQIHLRPGRLGDIPQCYSIYAYYVVNTVASMEHIVPSFEVFANELKDCWKEQLPFIVAVTRMNDPACETQQGAEASSSTNSNNHDNSNTTDLVLGYLYTLPLFHETGHKLRMAEQGTFIHPDLRKSGVGSRLTALNLNLIKAPGRYTSPPESLASENRVLATPLYPELDIFNYEEFRGVRLRPVKAMVRRTVVDEEGIGRGKSRFFEKFGFREVGYIKGAGEKMGRLWDLRFWELELVDWDEVRAVPKVEKANL